MALPTAYTEATLADYMVTELASSGLALAIVAASLQEAVYSAVFVYGVTDIANATDMLKLRAIARVEAWKYALATVAEEMRERTFTNYKIALKDAMAYVPYYAVVVGTMTYTDDPYQYRGGYDV